MRTFFLLAAIALAPAACSKKASDAPAKQAEQVQQIATVSVDQLDTLVANKECVPVDANGEQTRKKMGVIPGAVLLTDSDTFSVSELPPDKAKPLVFYCANNACGASDAAAHKAIVAGYTNVKVLPDGIAGWVKAGKKVATI
jgi:rhodanese-related sulfurtransferase